MAACRRNESMVPDTISKFRPELHEALLYIVLVVTISKPPVQFTEYFEAACTGTMIQQNLVLTAATCLQIDLENEGNPSNTMVYERTLGVRKALNIYIHPAFNNGQYYNYAVIHVENSRVEKFPLLPQNMFNIKMSLKAGGCVLGGYGHEGKSLPQFSHFKIMNINTSNTNVSGYSDETSLIISVNFEDLIACSGDIGSPIVCGGVLFAIFTSRPSEYVRDPRKCIIRETCHFAPVFPVIDWINRVIRSPVYSLSWMNNPWYLLMMCSAILAIIGTIYYCLIECMEKNFQTYEEEMAAPEEPLAEQISFSSTGTPRPKLRWSN